MKAKILVVDDEQQHADSIVESLEKIGYECLAAYSGSEAIDIVDSDRDINLVITDLVMRDVDGMAVLNYVKKNLVDAEVIIITAHGDVSNAVEAMKHGAVDFVQKPINIDELRERVKSALVKVKLVSENTQLQNQLDTRFGYHEIIGSSPDVLKIIEVLKQIAATNVTVLIQGESGTGKELVARAIHYNSHRRKNHFVPLNCAALSENILESELFGHEKGAFTGAVYQRKGRFEFANNGTLFLDEIGDMPMSIQIKLLRVIELGEVVRVGSNAPVKTDVRLIAATNKEIEQLVEENKFREDLFYRLKVVTVTLPPLRARQCDIPVLINHFVARFAYAHNRQITKVAEDALSYLVRYPWPGNVRELKNCVESMVVMSTSNVLTMKDIPEYISQSSRPSAEKFALSGLSMDETERQLIANTLKQLGGNRKEAAKQLNIAERTLYRKIKRYNIEY